MVDPRIELWQRLRHAKDWAGAIDDLEQESEKVSGERERSKHLFQLARLTEEVVPERDRALAIYQRAWKVDPENIQALAEARRVYRELGRLEMVAKLGELELRSGNGNPQQVAELAGMVGEALLDCRQRERALPFLYRALEASPESTRISDAIAAADYDPDNWIDAVERLTGDAEKADSATAARLLLRAARIVHQETPDDASYEDLLKRVLTNDPQNESANFLYEQHLAAKERWDELEAHHERRVYATPDDSERAELYRRFALEWVQRFKDRERGARFFAKAMKAVAEDGGRIGSLVAAFALVAEIYGARGQFGEVLGLVDACLDRLENPAQKLFIALQAGQIAWKHMGDQGRARRYFDVARTVEPAAPGLQEFDAQAPAAEIDMKPAPKAPEAAPAPDMKPAPSAPEGTPAQESKPVSDPQTDEKKKRKRGKKDTGSQTAVVEAEAMDQSQPVQAPPSPVAVAAAVAVAPEPPDMKPAPKAPEGPPAPPPPAAAPAPVRAAPEAPEEMTPELEAAMGKAAVARSGQKWKELIDALKEVESVAVRRATKAKSLREMSAVYRDHLRNDVQSLQSLNQALELTPDDMSLYDELAGQFEAKKRWPDLVNVLSRKAEHAGTPAERVALHLQVANLYIERFSNQAEAIKAFEKALELDPQNPAAIKHLLDVYEKRRDWEKLIRLREGEIARTTDTQQRFEKTLDVAKLAATKVKKPELCIVWWEKVLEHDPAHEEAINELYKLYERNKDWGRLAEICSKLADIAQDPKMQVDSLQKLGLLYTEKLEDAGKAIDAWRRLLEIEPENRRAQDAIKKLYVTAGRWDELEEFYRAGGKMDEFVRVLERQVETGEGGDQLGVAQKIALLYRDVLQKPDRAMRAFEKVLQLDPQNLEAAEALIPLYEAGRDPRKLAGVLEIQIANTPPGGERQGRMQKLAEFSEDKLRDKGAAFSWWLKMHGEDHEAPWIRESLERLARETGAWAELVGAYQTSFGKFRKRAQALPLMLVVAHVQEHELGEIDAALETNRGIYEIDDTNEAALAALERLYLGKQRYQDLLSIYDKRLGLSTDVDQRTQIQLKMGQLYEDEVKDDAKAIASYTAILDAVGDELGALRALDRLYARTGKWKELHDVLERELALVEPGALGAANPDHLELKYRLGQLREQHLDQVTGAIECYRDILDLEPRHGGARGALEKRLADDKNKLAAAGILEPIYEQVEEWSRLVEVHEIQLAAEKKNVGRRVGLLMRIGELHAKRLGDAERAFDAYSRCFVEDPTAEGPRRELEELCGLLDNGWRVLVGLYEDALGKKELGSGLAHELAIKVAHIYESRLDSSEKAVEFYRKALAIEPDDLEAMGALEQVFTREERYAELLEVYRKRADITSDAQVRLEILFRVAAIHEEMLNAPTEAIEAYSEVLGQDGSNLQALRALDRLFVAGKQWQDLGDNLSRQLALCEDDRERVGLLVRLARLRESELGEKAAAVETYRTVLELEPDNQDAVRALERLIAIEDHELAIAQILEPIYKAGGDWQKQVAVYEIMARHAYDPQRKIELYHQIAELNELGGDDGNQAFETYARAFREEPRSEQTQSQLERLSRMFERWKDLVGLYEDVIGKLMKDSGDDELKVQLLFKLARIHELELGDDASAVKTYGRILGVSGGHLDAASAIQAIHERNSDYPALVAVLKKKSEIILELPERKRLLYRAAQIQEEILEDREAAIGTFRQVLAIDDVDLPAMDALERLYIQLERWDSLKDVYAKKAELAEDPGDKRQLLLVLGQVYDVELKDVAKSIETYQAILDLDENDLDAILALDRLYGQGERWYEQLQNLERQVELADSSGEHVGLKYRIGHLWQTKLNDHARAIESYREALALDYTHQETLLALDGLLRSDQGEPVLAARVLEPIYEAAGEFARLIEVLEVMVKHAEDPHERVALLHRIAHLYEARLEQHLEAYNAFARALREDNGNPQTLAHLERLADITRVWTKLAELYAGEADKSLDVPRQVDLLTRLARIYEEELAQSEQAIATYRRILEAEFDNRPAVVALDRLYTGAERWQDLSGILRKEIQLAESDDEVLTHQFRLGQVLEQSLGDMRGAIEVYREILSTRPDHTATLGALEMMFLEGQHELEIGTILEPLYETAGEFEKLHKIYEVQLAKQSKPEERLRMFQQLGELAEKKLYDASRAFTWWAEAVVEDPRSEIAVTEAERLAGEISAWEELVNIYTRVLERHRDKKVQRDALLRLARVYEVELRDAVRAVQTHLRVLEIDAKDPDALAALDRLYEAAGMYEELVEVLRRRIEVTLDGDEVLQLHFRRGAIYADALADLDAALACYQAVLEQESRNRVALEAQEKIFFRREEWKKLYQTYEKMIDVADGDDEMADIYARMARLASDALEDEDGAIDMLGRVLDIRGEHPEPLQALADLHFRRERWEDLVEVLERQVGVTESAEGQVAVYKRLGRVWADKLGRERNALDAWLAADQLDPRDLETLNALANLYRSTQSWEELSQTLRRIIEVGQITGEVSEDALINLYAQLGQLEGDILGRVNDAVGAWRQVIALDPSNFEALGALESLFTREARWEEGIEVLEKRALVLDDPAQRIDTLLQAGAIWEEKVGDPEGAAAVYERVRQADTSNAIASERLEAIYRGQYRWEQLNEILLERVEHRSDVNERIAILSAVAKTYEEEIGDQDAAFVVLQAAFRENYAHENTAAQLVRLATATGKWEELLADYTEMVQGLESQDQNQACDLWVKIGRWYGDHLSHVDYAIHSISQALRLNPNHLGALSALADFQRKRGSWGELVETLGKHAALEPDPGRKVELYLSLADLLETQLQDANQAMTAYQQALAAEPGCMDALVALERLYRRHQMWEHLIDVLGRMAELRTDEEEISRLKREIGQLWDERMLDSGQAIIAYRAVLDTDPSNLAALRALEQLYEKTGQSEQYLEVLEAQLDASPTDAERISLYERMASAWEERFGKLDRSAECLEKIVAIDPRNFAAYRELERLYRQDEKWESLVDTYRNHISAITDPTGRIDLFCAMGETYEQRLNDYDRAIESYNDVLGLDSQEPRALDALGRLYERIQEWDRAIDVMSSLVTTVELPGQQVDLYHRIGRITHGQLNDPERAEEYFLRALSIQEGHVPSMESLVKLYSDRGDWIKAAQMMVRAEAYTPLVLDKVRLLYAAARIYLERLRQKDPAKQLLAAVIGLDPEHVEAAEPLAQLYFDGQEWEPLMPLLDMLVRKAQQEHNRDPRGLNDLYFRTAKTADELGDYDKAISFYKAAYDIDSTYLPTLVGRADLLFKMQDWDGAGKIYQTILVQHRDSQAAGDVVRIYYRLGMVRQNLGERRKALNMFEKALEIDPNHRDTLDAVINIQIAQNDYEAVVHAKRGLMNSADNTEKVKLLDEIGTIYQQQLNNQQKAIAAFLEALDVAPNDHTILQKVLDLYSATEQWKKAVETIDKFITLEANPVRKGTYYQAAATIVRDKLKGLDESIEYYNNALDAFFAEPDKLPASFLPRALKAFQDIDKILTTKRDWKNQERMYRKMIKRLPSGSPILIDLWHALGEIYRSRLKHYQSAISAFEVAHQLDPSNKNRGEILAELYLVAGPDYADKAVEQHMVMLRNEPFKYDSYKALRKIYMDTHQYDKTWCVCNTLAFLKKADPDEMQFYEQYKPRGFVKAKQRMTEDVWKRVHHPDENRYISAILGAIWQGAASLRAQPHKNFGLKPKDKRAVETDQLLFSRIFFYTAQVLNVPLPEVYLQDDQPGEILLANCVDKNRLIPAFVVRRDLLQGRSEKEIAFAAARKLCFMRPEHYLKLALPTNTELKTALLSAIVLVRPDFPVPGDMRANVQSYLPEMQKRIPPHVLEQLSAVVARFLQAAPEVNMAAWGHAVEATSHRAGFVICGDLETAARMVSAEPTVVGGPQAKDKIKELVLYSVSEDYFAVRHHLGLTIG